MVIKVITAFPPDFRLIPSCILSPSLSLPLPFSLSSSPSLSLSLSLSLSPSLLPLQTNTFQCILASSENNQSYVFFLYSDSSMEWPGSPYALVGLNAGDGVRHLTIPTSQSEAVLNIAQTSNSRASDMWVFRTDASDIIQPGWSFFASCMCVMIEYACMQEQGCMMFNFVFACLMLCVLEPVPCLSCGDAEYVYQET